jgi:transposase
MAKISLKFQQEVAEKYLEGELSPKSVAKIYNLCPSSVRKWA